MLFSVSADQWEPVLSEHFNGNPVGKTGGPFTVRAVCGAVPTARREAFSRRRIGPGSCGKRCELAAVPRLRAEPRRLTHLDRFPQGMRGRGKRPEPTNSKRQFSGGRLLTKCLPSLGPGSTVSLLRSWIVSEHCSEGSAHCLVSIFDVINLELLEETVESWPRSDSLHHMLIFFPSKNSSFLLPWDQAHREP